MIRIALIVFGLTMLFNIGASAQKIDCSKMTEADIVKSIYDKVKVKHDGEIMHVNVTIKDGVATLEGWTTTKGARKDIEKYAKKMSCVKSVVNDLSVGKTGGCGPGTKQCGDICIPTSQTCNICTAKTCN